MTGWWRKCTLPPDTSSPMWMSTPDAGTPPIQLVSVGNAVEFQALLKVENALCSWQQGNIMHEEGHYATYAQSPGPLARQDALPGLPNVSNQQGRMHAIIPCLMPGFKNVSAGMKYSMYSAGCGAWRSRTCGHTCAHRRPMTARRASGPAAGWPKLLAP